ncbi:MAG: D-alanyl-D-alanine carboxypeptidase family protein [Sphingomonadaceae bacterium]
MLFRLFACLLCFAVVQPLRAATPPEEIAPVPVVMLVDTGSGRVLVERKPGLRFIPASMTKVMTAYVAFEEMAAGRLSPDRRFAVKPETAKLWNAKGTSMYLLPSDQPTTHDLLRGIMTGSANDAAIVLAEGYAGSVPAWTFLMNDSAKKLGMTNSHFNTPNGWPDKGKTYVSARDLVTLGTAMLRRFPNLYRTYSGKLDYEWNRHMLYSHDPVTNVVEGADGIKTGFTREAGYNFLGSAERDGRRLVMVVAGAKTDSQRMAASRALLEWGFAEWAKRPLFGAGERVGSARVQDGAEQSVALAVGRETYATVDASGGEKIVLKIAYRGPLRAPIAKGAKVADLVIKVGDAKPGRVPLYTADAVAKAGPMDRLRNGLMTLFR